MNADVASVSMTSGATVLAWLKEEKGGWLGLEPERTRDSGGNQATGLGVRL